MGLVDGGLLLGGDHDLLGLVGLARVVRAMAVPGLPILAAPHRGHDVADGGNRIRLDHLGVDALLRLEHPDQGLLHQVLRRGVLPHPCTDDPAQHRDQRGHVGRTVRHWGFPRVPSRAHLCDLTPRKRFPPP